MPTVEGFFFGRLIEYDAGLHQPTSRPWYLMTQLNVVAQKVASRKISVEASGWRQPSGAHRWRNWTSPLSERKCSR